MIKHWKSILTLINALKINDLLQFLENKIRNLETVEAIK